MSTPLPLPPHKPRRPLLLGFSLVEVTLALGLVSFALIASLGLVSIGLNSARDSVDDTVTSLVFQSACNSVTGQPLEPGTLGPFYFDKEGIPKEKAVDAYFEVNAELKVPTKPAPLDDANLLAATIQIKWPLVKGTIPASAQNRGAVATFLVTTATPKDWKDAQSSFKPKIEL